MSVTPDDGRTHWHGCEQERGHHACALAELARLRAELDAIGAVVGWSRERCEQDGDSPLDCAIMMRAELERATQARDRARAERDRAAKLLHGIYALMYPAPIATNDGRTMVFRPQSLDPHAVLQELSDRIRALSDALAQEPPA